MTESQISYSKNIIYKKKKKTTAGNLKLLMLEKVNMRKNK